MKKSSLFAALLIAALLSLIVPVPSRAQSTGAYVRFIHVSGDLSGVQGAFGGKAVTDTLTVGDASPYIKFDAGTYKFAFIKPNADVDPAKGADITLVDGATYSLIAVGQLADNSLLPLVVNEGELLKSIDAVPDTSSPFLFIPGFSGGDPVDVYINDTLMLPGSKFSTMGILAVPQGVFKVKVTKAGDPNTELASTTAISFKGVFGFLGFSGASADALKVRDGYGTTLNALDFFKQQSSQTTISFNDLLAQADAANLTDSLSADGPFTILAAADSGYATPYGSDPAAMVAQFKQNVDTTAKLFNYHIADGRQTLSKLIDIATSTTPTLKTRSGDIKVEINSGIMFNGESTGVIYDIQTTNATIQLLSAPMVNFK